MEYQGVGGLSRPPKDKDKGNKSKPGSKGK